MKYISGRGFFWTGGVLLASGLPLAAQTAEPSAVAISTSPQFFMAVIGGVILAIGFQILLTFVSVASGISLIGNVEEKAQAAGPSESASSDGDNDAQGGGKEDEGEAGIYKIPSAIGIWTLVTASVSLFFASLLAVRLSWEGTLWMGITLGLIIWATFFALLTYLEVRSVSTLIGGLFSTAIGGLRSSFAAVKGVFAKSPEDRVFALATDTVDHLREELSQAFDDSEFAEKIDEYATMLKPKPFDYEKAKGDLIEILKNIKLEEHAEMNEGQLDRQTFLKMAKEHPHLSRENMDKVGSLFDEAMQAVKSADTGSGKVDALIDRLSPEGHEAREKVENYLKKTGQEEIDPEQIKNDIDKMFEDPKAAPGIVKQRLDAIDHDTMVAVLEQRDDLSHEKAEKIVSSVERGVAFVREKVTQAEGQASAASGMGKGAAAAVTALPRQAEDRLRGYMDSIGRPEFNYDRVRLDFERMFHHPKDTPTIVKARLKMYDRDSLVALLSSREDISEEDADRMIGKIEEARDRAMHKIDKIEKEVSHQIDTAKRTAIHEAENVRKASASAAWWMVGTAVGSGAFSALGAALAVSL